MSTHEPPAPAAPVPTAGRQYAVVPAKVDLAAVDQQVLALWADNDVFHRSLAQREGAPEWTFYEGPPTANGTPGTHHVEARVFKDVFPRFKTMRGYRVDRKAGWDCHGLPVELAVEKELGFTGKGDIEAYGVAEFNARCRESVLRHVDEFAVLTERMGYWVDMDQAYWTMDPAYIQSVWWSLKQIFDKGLLVQDHRVSPYCPRCGTGLSDHELAQGYEDVIDPSVYVRMPVTSGPLAERFPGVSLLVWTTTPWTLVSNTAVAVKPDAAVPGGPRDRRDGRLRAARDRRGTARGEAPRGPRGPGHHARSGPGVHRVLPAVRPGGHPRRPLRDPGRLRDDRGWLRTGPPVAGVRRRGPHLVPRIRPAGGQPAAARRHLRPVRPPGRRDVLQGRGPDPGGRPRGARPDVPPRAPGALLPALLALPHPLGLLRPALLVHPDHRHQGRAAPRERGHHLAPGDHQVGAVRGLAGEQRRLGLVAQPVLGHAAADLALRAGPPDLYRVPRRARRARRPGPVRAGPAPPSRRRRHLRLPAVRRDGNPRPGGHRRLVRQRRDALRPVGLPAHGHRRVRAQVPRRLHLRGDRPDPRLVLHADGDRHAGLRPVVLPDRAGPRPHPRR